MTTALRDLDHYDADVRECILKILFRIHQCDKELGVWIQPVLFAHRGKLVSGMQTDEVESEIALVDDCLAAPMRPFTLNYQIPAEECK